MECMWEKRHVVKRIFRQQGWKWSLIERGQYTWAIDVLVTFHRISFGSFKYFPLKVSLTCSYAFLLFVDRCKSVTLAWTFYWMTWIICILEPPEVGEFESTASTKFKDAVKELLSPWMVEGGHQPEKLLLAWRWFLFFSIAIKFEGKTQAVKL